MLTMLCGFVHFFIFFFSPPESDQVSGNVSIVVVVVVAAAAAAAFVVVVVVLLLLLLPYTVQFQQFEDSDTFSVFWVIFGVSIIHRTLMWTTGSLTTCVAYAICFACALLCFSQRHTDEVMLNVLGCQMTY